MKYLNQSSYAECCVGPWGCRANKMMFFLHCLLQSLSPSHLSLFFWLLLVQLPHAPMISLHVTASRRVPLSLRLARLRPVLNSQLCPVAIRFHGRLHWTYNHLSDTFLGASVKVCPGRFTERRRLTRNAGGTILWLETQTEGKRAKDK